MTLSRHAALSPALLAVHATRGRWKLARWLALVADELVAIARGETKRLIVQAPPRHGKSELISRWFPAWYLGVFPDREVILATYEATFAESWGGKARDVLEEHGALFGVQVRQDSRARDRWGLEGRAGTMHTAGVGGPVTGKGAHLLIVDDPVKNAEEANSAAQREKVWDWWQSTAFTRLEPAGAAVLLMTRWHEDDLAGRLISEGGWKVLRLPALADGPDDPLRRAEGEALWPARYDATALEEIRRAVGSYWFAALYQQRPAPKGGLLFNPAWFKPAVEPEAVPAKARRVRYWDMAATEETGSNDPDWTVGVKLAELDGAFWIEDVQRLRGRPHAVEALVKATAEADGESVLIAIEQEPGSAGKAVVEHYQREVLKGFAVHADKVTGDKITRAGPLSAAAEAGNVKIVRGEWNAEYLAEMETFPNGAHDDQVDATAGAHAKVSRFLRHGTVRMETPALVRASPWRGV